ncbi:hypothetical protein J6590_078619 [Homalodisca vitripennis]|nr:hypothetical protein J6590_078619 [Homalodisca vitripennis]
MLPISYSLTVMNGPCGSQVGCTHIDLSGGLQHSFCPGASRVCLVVSGGERGHRVLAAARSSSLNLDELKTSITIPDYSSIILHIAMLKSSSSSSVSSKLVREKTRAD